MRPLLFIPILACLTAAENGIPECAKDCVTKYTAGTEIAGCKQLEIDCICANDEFLDRIACCLEDACDQSGKDAAVQYAHEICSTAGVDVPDEVVCKGSFEETEGMKNDEDGAASGLSTVNAAAGAIILVLMAL